MKTVYGRRQAAFIGTLRHTGARFRQKKRPRITGMRGRLEKIELLAGSSTSLADHAGNRFGRLCAHAEPLVGLFEVDRVVGAFLKRIVRAELFNVATIAALAGIHSDDFVVRAILGALAVESESYGHNVRRF